MNFQNDQPRCSLMNVREAAVYLGQTERWVYRHCQRGAVYVLPHLRLGKYLMFRQLDLDQWIEKCLVRR